MDERLSKSANVVTIGGGTGSFNLLSELKNHFEEISAIVNMADSGGSSGELRDEHGVLPPGDVRQCLVALSPESAKLREVFSYRFEKGGLSGHAFGNIFLTALEKTTGSFAEAVETASELLNIKGRVIPVTLDNVQLWMTWPESKQSLKGESVIDLAEFSEDPREAHLTLEPLAKANNAALTAIKEADLVVLAPGDLYTSLAPALAAEGLGDALADTAATVVYVCNLVTKPGHTDGFDVAEHAAEIERFAGGPILDYVLYNTEPATPQLAELYLSAGKVLVEVNAEKLRQRHYRAIGRPLISQTVILESPNDRLSHTRSLIRHNARAVADAIIELTLSRD